MSTITRVHVHTHCNDLGGKVWNPTIRWTKKYAVFITLENDNGLIGHGECWCFDTSPDVLIAYIKTEIAPQIIGKTLEECLALYKQLLSRATLTARHGLLASAWSGFDIALWDLRSRAANLPLWKLLQSHTAAGKQAPKPEGIVRLYASGGLYGQAKTTDDLVDEMLSMQSAGFDIVKMKIGGLSIEEDLERIHAVLSGISPSSKLIIDGVYSYSESQALQLFKALPTMRIEAFQSPLIADNISGMKSLTEHGVPVMATEAEYRLEVHQQLINSGAIKFLQTAPIACGGISRLIELNQPLLPSEKHTPQLSLEVSSTAIALMAAMHFAAACDQVAHVEYHYLHQVFFNHLELHAVSNQLGFFELPDVVGLGITFPENETTLAFSQT